MIRSRIQLFRVSVCLLSLLVILTACTPKLKPVDEPADTPPPSSAIQPGQQVAPPDTGEVEEVSEPWGGEPVATEEKLGVTAMEARAQEFNEQEVLGDIFFSFDKSDLSEEARGRLAAHARWLRAHAEFGLLIEGHCDERDTDEYNLALGDRRANSARDYLILLGIDAQRLQTISYGEERPVDPGHTEAAWAKNRRGHFVVQVLEGG
jgi:peptidoglycan-associated lipoprotein